MLFLFLSGGTDKNKMLVLVCVYALALWQTVCICRLPDGQSSSPAGPWDKLKRWMDGSRARPASATVKSSDGIPGSLMPFFEAVTVCGRDIAIHIIPGTELMHKVGREGLFLFVCKEKRHELNHCWPYCSGLCRTTRYLSVGRCSSPSPPLTVHLRLF